MKQLTREQAIAMHDSGAWRSWTDIERASFQMIQRCLCMPFDEFHKSLEAAIGRPVWTHELGLNHESLLRELAGIDGHPSMKQIIGLIPPEKLLIAAA
jgi:hypothetical protein